MVASEIQGLQTNVSTVETNVPVQIPTEEVVDFVVGDGPEGPTASRQRPGKKRRNKWMRRLQEAAQRALAHASSIPAGLSRKSRKRKRMGMGHGCSDPCLGRSRFIA